MHKILSRTDKRKKNNNKFIKIIKMENIDKKVLGICSVCKAIKVDDENQLWLKREDNPRLYDLLIEKYKENLSHGICPEDFKKNYGEYYP
jgi:hypothetical protein